MHNWKLSTHTLCPRWGVKWNHLSMMHRLTTDYAKNYCNRTLLVQVILVIVVTCFFWDTVRLMDSGTRKVKLSVFYWTVLWQLCQFSCMWRCFTQFWPCPHAFVLETFRFHITWMKTITGPWIYQSCSSRWTKLAITVYHAVSSSSILAILLVCIHSMLSLFFAVACDSAVFMLYH